MCVCIYLYVWQVGSLWFVLVDGDGKDNTLFQRIFMILFIRIAVVGSALCLDVFVLMWWNFDWGSVLLSCLLVVLMWSLVCYFLSSSQTRCYISFYNTREHFILCRLQICLKINLSDLIFNVCLVSKASSISPTYIHNRKLIVDPNWMKYL